MYRLQTFAGYPLTVDLASTFSYKVTTTIEYPDLPAGNLEGDGALIDLTVLGIKGDVRTLRPSGQIDYFKQAHLFIENGIEVERLLDGGVSSSSDYPDLVYYLMRQSRVIVDDQIALQSMKDAVKRVGSIGCATTAFCKRHRTLLSGSQGQRLISFRSLRRSMVSMALHLSARWQQTAV